MAGGAEEDWRWLEKVVGPALALVPPDIVDEVATRLNEAGVQDAVRRHDSRPIVDFLCTLIGLQGVSDERAWAWDDAWGAATFAQIEAGFRRQPVCAELRSFAAYRCGYRKTSRTCRHPEHQPQCPVPRLPLRKGGINVAVHSLWLFIRDLCGGDFVGWIDATLAAADPGPSAPDRARRMRSAVLEPLTRIVNTGPKIWSMMLAELLLVGDPARDRWVTTGASFVAVDGLVHNHLHRVGAMRRIGIAHPIGAGCYAPGGCADLIEVLARRFDAKSINQDWPMVFPRLVQSAIWRFCSKDLLNICNGNRIDDRASCRQLFCPAGPHCERVALRSRALY